MGLSAATTRDAMTKAMNAWEAENPDELEPATSSATHLFGFAGQPRLAGRFDYVFVPAVSDAQEQTRHARGTLMQQVVARSVANQPRVEERLKAIHEETAERVDAVLREEHGDELKHLSGRFTDALREYVPSGTVSFVPHPLEMRMPSMQVGMRVTDGGFESEVGRQGHGFQRALLMTAVQELARAGDGGSAPALFLAIEEPELYQHPSQARHFAKTLSELPRSGEGAIQVAYATHSEHFVDPVRYERGRRFRKEPDALSCPTAKVSSATIRGVAERLSGVVQDWQVPKKVAITLQRTLSEAVFAHAVLLVEGRTDEALLRGVADREGGFDAMGIAVVHVGGKTNLAVPWAAPIRAPNVAGVAPWRAVPQASFPRPFSLMASSIFSTSGLTLSRKRASASSEKPGSQAAERISREKPLIASRKAPQRPLELPPNGEDVGQGRFLERRQASEEVRRDPAVAPPRGARLRGREETVPYRFADEVPGQVVEERVRRGVRHRVRGLI